MKLYTIHSNDYRQLLAKNIRDVDDRINAIVSFIDNFNANYTVLNLPNEEGLSYYNYNQLTHSPLNILIEEWSNTEPSELVHIWADPNKMHTHQVLDNTYIQDIGITGDGVTWETTRHIPQGFALRCDGYNKEQKAQYSIISLANSGTYYVLETFNISNINTADREITCEFHWIMQDNATDNFGLYYLLSFTIPGARFYYHSPSTALIQDNLIPFTLSPIITSSFISTPTNVSIGTSTKGIWTVQYLLTHDNYLKTTTSSVNTFEEVYDDYVKSTDQTRIGEYPQSRYTITTNMVDTLSKTDGATTYALVINLY